MTSQPEDRRTEYKSSIHFGAVYFRKTNPPRRDWERDYTVAVEDGHNMFRHWFPWGAIEVAPGEFDWEDYDIHLDLAQKYGIDTVIAEMITDVPEWLYHRYPHARRETIQGVKRPNMMHGSCITGGHNAMCLDNPEVAELAGRFLRELALRYRSHPALYGYDIWNECSLYDPQLICYCPATQARFREWLKRKYGDLRTLGKAWFRYSFTTWEDVELPRTIGPYPDVLDAIAFQNDNTFQWMQWRADLLRSADPEHPILAHGNAKSFSDIAPACGDDYRAAEIADVFGYTYWYSNRCHTLLASDMIRSASKGKPFWRAEAIGNSTWEQRRADSGPAPEKDEMAEPENIRLDSMISFMAGARGYLNPRWRPLLDGPLFGAYGWYGMDGSRTERSEMACSIAKWAHQPANERLWKSKPVKGEAAVLLLEEAQAHCYAAYGSTQYYSLSLQGVYEAFMHANIQCDIIKLDQIHDYAVVYVPFPVALKDSTVSALIEWTRSGGSLIGEAGFGYFTDQAHAIETQPNRGMEAVFGCREKRVSFGLERWNDLKITARLPEGDALISGGLLRQSYELQGAAAAGWFEDGEVAVTDHAYGKGKARLAGSMIGYGYKKRPDEQTKAWFASLLHLNGSKPMVQVNKSNVIARLSSHEGRYFLWVLNENVSEQTVTVTVDERIAAPRHANVLRGRSDLTLAGQCFTLTVEGRDAAILELN
ncbi:beta-galactosidase [Paenibacillus humicola]|uniref:beta-galactosidase n=1 Tax=Paenibacillus humicola TaxID=3110540 RepID=UPI00237B1029|nr:beta-galactosidase [Paenibacillus humicola]